MRTVSSAAPAGAPPADVPTSAPESELLASAPAHEAHDRISRGDGESSLGSVFSRARSIWDFMLGDDLDKVFGAHKSWRERATGALGLASNFVPVGKVLGLAGKGIARIAGHFGAEAAEHAAENSVLRRGAGSSGNRFLRGAHEPAHDSMPHAGRNGFGHLAGAASNALGAAGRGGGNGCHNDALRAAMGDFGRHTNRTLRRTCKSSNPVSVRRCRKHRRMLTKPQFRKRIRKTWQAPVTLLRRQRWARSNNTALRKTDVTNPS